MVHAQCTAWEVVGAAAVRDLTPSPALMSWEMWCAAAQACGALLELEYGAPTRSTGTNYKVRSINHLVTETARGTLLTILRNAGQTIGSEHVDAWVGLVREAARAVHAKLLPTLYTKLRAGKCTRPLKHTAATPSPMLDPAWVCAGSV
jgi:hypothetical protein